VEGDVKMSHFYILGLVFGLGNMALRVMTWSSKIEETLLRDSAQKKSRSSLKLKSPLLAQCQGRGSSCQLTASLH
jgi:hypothetical protein